MSSRCTARCTFPSQNFLLALMHSSKILRLHDVSNDLDGGLRAVAQQFLLPASSRVHRDFLALSRSISFKSAYLAHVYVCLTSREVKASIKRDQRCKVDCAPKFSLRRASTVQDFAFHSRSGGLRFFEVGASLR